MPLVLRMSMSDVGDRGNATGDKKCVPLVSQYTDCTDETMCSGCSQCKCNASGLWECERVKVCTTDEMDDYPIDDTKFESALNQIKDELKRAEMNNILHSDHPNVPQPDTEAPFLEYFTDSDVGEEIREMLRYKRSVIDDSDEKDNRTVTFHNIVDEIDEDTLKSANISGTLQATKVDNIPQASRRSLNNVTSNALQIEHTPPIFNPHAGDNKVDAIAIHDDKEDLMIHHKIYEVVGNQTLEGKDKDLSKLVVNELKRGAETIGDENSSPISNITFTPENDTLTAVAFIAGNLLNKLWKLEKDAGDDSMETETLKHKKVNDLLDLFKEPLNLRQETFLKNALKQLSTAMENKDVGNISLCENIEVLKKISNPENKTSKEHVKKIKEKSIDSSIDVNREKTNKTIVTSKALKKIKNILDLINKYERVQSTLKNLKKSKNNLVADQEIDSEIKTVQQESFSKDEEGTISVFGRILESLTKLLVPDKKSKKIIKGVKSSNIFIDDKEVKDRFKMLNLTGITMTTKDKIVLDYLTHIQSSPDCLFRNKQRENPSLPSIEGNILLNLSEFFKIKSMSDLVKLLEIEKRTVHQKVPTTETIKDALISTTEIITQTRKKLNASKFETTKEKLKGHLKTILEDLIELQNINGQSTKGKGIEIADALPCIYNLLNANKDLSDNVQSKILPKKDKTVIKPEVPLKKITEIFENAKKELIKTPQIRRSNIPQSVPRPKSAVIWERMIKNNMPKQELKTRRALEGNIPKSLEDINKLIEKIENSGSNTYKTIAYLAEVPAAERLLLLKTLAVDTKKYISVLQDLKRTIETVKTISRSQNKAVNEFVDNVDININLNEKVIKNLDKPKGNIVHVNKQTRYKKVSFAKPPIEVTETPLINVAKLNRDQIINQLIKNRMLSYMRLKETSNDENRNSVNYNLAKKVVFYLEIGNENLARELFKVFVSQNKRDSMNRSGELILEPDSYVSASQHRTERRLAQKVPLIQFEEPSAANRELSLSNQDQLIRRLLNIKNMKV